METHAAWQAVFDRLTTATGPLAYADGRVYPLRLTQRTPLPAYTFQVITTDREHAMGADPGHVHARVQVDVYDNDYRGTASGSRHARTALSRFRGTATGLVVDDVFVDNEREAFEEDLEDAERVMWRRTLDFIIHYRE